MRLLIITQALDRRHPILGFFHEWVRVFAQHADEVHVVCLQAGEQALPKNVHVYSLGKEQGGNRLQYLWRFFRFIVRRRHVYDSVFVHMNVEYVLLGGLLWRLMGKRVLLWYTHKMVHWRLRVATYLAHAVATASPESFRLRTEKVHVLGHGIDCDVLRSRRVPSVGESWVTTGRISESKRVVEMVDIVRALRAAGHRVRLDMYGDLGSPADAGYIARVQQCIEQAGLDEEVRLCGPLPHRVLLEKLPSYDVFLNLSATGSMDKAVLEALCAGVPVITSNEAFAHGVPVVFVQDTTQATMAAALAKARQADPATLRAYVSTHHSLPVLIERLYRLCIK